MRLRLLTWNIHRAIGVDRRFRLDRIVEVIAHHEPQIVLLQEVDDGAPRSKELDLARELARELGFRHFVMSPNVTLKQGRYGNAVLSKFPIDGVANLDLSLPESWIRRGCQHLVLDLARGRRLNLFNLHLGLSARERQTQIGLLARGALLELPLDAPTIVGGDFNDWRSLLHPIFTEILGFSCATELRSGRGGPIRTYPSFSPRGGLDRFYTRGPLTTLAAHSCRLKLSRIASDHLPVIADLRLDG